MKKNPKNLVPSIILCVLVYVRGVLPIYPLRSCVCVCVCVLVHKHTPSLACVLRSYVCVYSRFGRVSACVYTRAYRSDVCVCSCT